MTDLDKYLLIVSFRTCDSLWSCYCRFVKIWRDAKYTPASLTMKQPGLYSAKDFFMGVKKDIFDVAEDVFDAAEDGIEHLEEDVVKALE